MKYFSFFIVLSLQAAWTELAAAENVPLCQDLAQFAAVPGTFADGTGQFKSDEMVQDKVTQYAHDTEGALKAKIETDPGLKKLSFEAFGQDRGVEGTVHLIQRSALGEQLKNKIADTNTNFQRLDDMLQKTNYQKILLDYKHTAISSLVNSEVTTKAKEKIFPQVKSLLMARIRKLNISEQQQTKLIEKINAVQFDNSSCDTLVAGSLAPNAFFNGTSVKYCNPGLQSTSEFQIAFSLAQEISQSISPANASSEQPLKNLSRCLADTKSVHGEPDQISTAIAGWLATEILPDYIDATYKSKLTTNQFRNGYSNVFRTLGPVGEDINPETHLPTATMYNQMILANPKIRAQMACTQNNTTALYCDGDAVTPRNSSVPTARKSSTETQPGKL